MLHILCHNCPRLQPVLSAQGRLLLSCAGRRAPCAVISQQLTLQTQVGELGQLCLHPSVKAEVKELSDHPSTPFYHPAFKNSAALLYTAVCEFLENRASSEPFPVQFWAVMTTREHGRASVAWESQCSVFMPLTGENCLPMPWLIPPWFFHEVGVLWAAGMPGSLCSKPGRICVGSQLGSDLSCLPAQAIVQWEQGLSSHRASPTTQTYVLHPVPVLLQEGQFVTQVSSTTSWSSAPQKLVAAILREKGKHEEAGAEIFLHRNS